MSGRGSTAVDNREPWPTVGGVASAREVRWRLDPRRTRVEFVFTRLWGLRKMSGLFSAVSGILDIRRGVEREVGITIDASSVYTRDRKRDQLLRSADFLNADACPQIQFVAGAVTPISGIDLDVAGNLLIAGRTVPVESTLNVVRADNDLNVVVEAELEDRKLGMRRGSLAAPGRRICITIRARMVAEAARTGADGRRTAEG